jgi:hypothetical protein
MRSIDISAESMENNAQAMIWDINGNNNQRFKFIMVSPNVYQIMVQHSQMYLAPQGRQQGAKVV